MNEQTIQYHLENIRKGNHVIGHVNDLNKEIKDIRLQALSKNISQEIRLLLNKRANKIEKDLQISTKLFIDKINNTSIKTETKLERIFQ